MDLVVHCDGDYGFPMRTSIASVVGALALATLSLHPSAGLAADRPSEGFRKEHVEIKTHLDHVKTWAGELPTLSEADRVKRMNAIVGFFQQHIKPHAEWEEKVLYPAVDKRACTGAEPFTATMRFEHGVVGRWIEELAAEAKKPKPDATAFARRTDNLLGLLLAHFEEEEEVLLPILDKSMTAEQFEQEIGGGAHK